MKNYGRAFLYIVIAIFNFWAYGMYSSDFNLFAACVMIVMAALNVVVGLGAHEPQK